MAMPKKIFNQGYTAIKKCKHGYFAYNTNDLFVGKSLDIYGEWCEPEIEAIDPLISKGDIILDVGAFIGTHTVYFAKKTGPRGFVFAFEPQRIFYNYLCANLTLNNLINVKCFNAALTDTRQIIKVPIINPAIQQNFGAVGERMFTHGDPVDAVAIDDLNLGRCNFIKIDSEGMEAKILKGAKKTITKYSPLIFAENNRPEGSKETISTLLGYGYKCYWHISKYYNPNNFFKNKENIFEGYAPEANILCIPKGSKTKTKNLIKVVDENDTWEKALLRIVKK